MHEPSAPLRRLANRLRAGIPLLVALGLSACTAQLVDVHAEDTSVLGKDARASWELRGDQEPAGDSAPDAGRVVSIDFEISHTGGASDQLSLPSGQGILLGNHVYSGELEAEFDLTRLLVDARLSSPPKHGFRVEGFVGVEWSSLDFTLRDDGSPVRSADSDVTSIGPAFGAALVYEPQHWLRCSVEGRLSYGVSAEISGVQQNAFDIGVSVFPLENVGLYGGWRNLGYNAERADHYTADLDLQLAGPVIALRLRF